jgi:hypothetical protein
MGTQPGSESQSENVDSWNTEGKPSPGPPPPSGSGEKPTSGLAIASLVCGLAGVLFCGLPSIVGLILGIVAMKKISESQGRLGGHGLALAGTIVSGVMIFVGLVMTAVLAAMLMPASARARTEARKAACMSNIHNIGIGLQMYQNHHGEWPESLQDIHPEYINSTDIFRCPADEATESGDFPDSYLYRRPSPGADVQNTPVVFDKADNHSGGRVVLFPDKHVEFLSEEEFRRRGGAP